MPGRCPGPTGASPLDPSWRGLLPPPNHPANRGRYGYGIWESKPQPSRARARRGAWGYAPNPLNLSRGWGLELGTPYVCRSLCQGTAHTEFPPREVAFAETWARKGSMEQSVHRPFLKSGLPSDRRVNYAVCERGPSGSASAEPSAPVVADCSIDSSTVSTPAA